MAPNAQGLYNPAFEHDACGVAMVADMHGRRSRDIVEKASTAGIDASTKVVIPHVSSMAVA